MYEYIHIMYNGMVSRTHMMDGCCLLGAAAGLHEPLDLPGADAGAPGRTEDIKQCNTYMVYHKVILNTYNIQCIAHTYTYSIISYHIISYRIISNYIMSYRISINIY